MDRIEFIAEQISLMLPSIKRKLLSNGLQNVQISPTQLFVILNLSENDNCNLKHLCAEMKVTPPAMTGIIDRLEAAGYVQRMHDKKDRRSINLILTSSGKDLALKLKSEIKNQLLKILRKLTEEDREKYFEIINKIYKLI